MLKFIYISFATIIFYIAKKIGLKPDICKFLHMLGPSYIKLGQSLSIRPDIIGQDYANQLKKLQDNVPPFSHKRAIKILNKNLNAKFDEIFKNFDHTPVASASIAQVYKATLTSGEDVAVKILRPNIRKKFNSDIRIFTKIAYILNLIPSLKRLKLKEVVKLHKKITKKELDLRLEAAAGSKLRDNFINDNKVYVPNIFWEFCNENILITQWVDAISVYDKEQLAEFEINTENLAKDIYIFFLNQAYRDGYFHADLHPGNILISKTGQIIPIDFGIMGSLDMDTRFFVAEILRGFLTKDYKLVADVHFEAGFVPKSESRYDFELAARAIGEPILGMAAKDISLAKLLGLLFKITKDFNMQTQTQLLLLQKTLVLIEGVCKNLDPNINLWECATPWMQNWAEENLSIKARVKRKITKLEKILNKIIENIE